MNKYYIASTNANLGFFPNYSFEVGDINGDGKIEFIALNQSGDLLKAIDLDGRLLFERKLNNTGTWGTPLICAADLNCDGRCEIITPDGKNIAVFDGQGNKIAERAFNNSLTDDFGINIPLLGVACVVPGEKNIIAAAAGGTVYALDKNLNIVWETGGLRRDFGHEIHFADIDGDGLDEIAFCTVDNIKHGYDKDKNVGELIILDHDGTVLLRKRVDDCIPDSHYDDIAMADFMGDGTTQILVEKGILLDLQGNIIWDLSHEMEHGQWIAHAPNPATAGGGKVAFISELWSTKMQSMLFTGQGQRIKDISGFPWPVLDPGEYSLSNMPPLPTRCHVVRWGANCEPEIFFSQQAFVPFNWETLHTCMQDARLKLSALFMDLQGNLLGELPFDDALVAGYFYNGETHSKVADVDGDNRQEIVFPRQDGRVMVIKKVTGDCDA